jgi:predicted small secreted protein
MTRKLAVALFGIAVASPLALTGCNTVQGFGQDISATGRAVENVATYNAPSHYYYSERYYVDRWGNRHYY